MKTPRSAAVILLLLLELLTATVALADPVLLQVLSRKTHGAAGVRELPLRTGIALSGAISVEPRAIGAGHNIVFQFDSPVTSVGTITVTDGNGANIGSASPSMSGQELVVTLTGIPDNVRVLISANSVNGLTNVAVAAGFLIGDSDSNASVDASDLSAVKSRSGQTVTGTVYL